MRLLALEALWPKLSTACGAVVGGAATALGAIAELLMQILGVPLPVVVASSAAAGLARAVMPPVGFFRALLLTGVWVIIGCAGAPLLQSVGPAIAQAIFNREVTLPANTLAALAAIVSSTPWWWPKVWPWLQAKLGIKPATPAGGDGQGNAGGGNAGGGNG